MMNYNEWKILKESLGGMTLGFKKPHTIAGPPAPEEDDFEGDFEDDEDGEGAFPTDLEDEMGDQSDFEDDASNLDGATDDGDLDDLMAGLDGVEGAEGAAGHEGELPCPDCNADGSQEMGEENCPHCHGLGFVPEEGDEGVPSEDPMAPAPEGDAPSFESQLSDMIGRKDKVRKEFTHYQWEFPETEQEADLRKGCGFTREEVEAAIPVIENKFPSLKEWSKKKKR